jgi:hypothetical protein
VRGGVSKRYKWGKRENREREIKEIKESISISCFRL